MGIFGGAGVEPVLGLIAVIAAVTFITMLVLRMAARRQERADPLTGLFERETLDFQLNRTAEAAPRISQREAARLAVLSGRIDHMSQVRQIFGQHARSEAIEQVAQVMRAGLRKTDRFSSSDGENFEILVEGANEAEAGIMARRLMSALARVPMPEMSDSIRLTASFGIAEKRFGETDDEMRARAQAALDAASVTGADKIVTSSEWEEIMLLPPPEDELGERSSAAGSSGTIAA